MVPPFCHIRVKDGHFASPNWGGSGRRSSVGTICKSPAQTEIELLEEGLLLALAGRSEEKKSCFTRARPSPT